jgi:hypothetical protein
MKYPKMEWGTIEAVVNKLGGMDGVSRFLRDELRVVEISPPFFPAWRTLKLGTGPNTAAGFNSVLKNNCHQVSVAALKLLEQTDLLGLHGETRVELAVVSVTDLGFEGGATRADIYCRAQERGLSICPPSVGPQLRLQYSPQPRDEYLYVAMEPIKVDGSSRVYTVFTRGSESWLCADVCDGNTLGSSIWSADRCVVFVRRTS